NTSSARRPNSRTPMNSSIRKGKTRMNSTRAAPCRVRGRRLFHRAISPPRLLFQSRSETNSPEPVRDRGSGLSAQLHTRGCSLLDLVCDGIEGCLPLLAQSFEAGDTHRRDQRDQEDILHHRRALFVPHQPHHLLLDLLHHVLSPPLFFVTSPSTAPAELARPLTADNATL